MHKEWLSKSNMKRHSGENLEEQTSKVVLGREEEEKRVEGKVVCCNLHWGMGGKQTGQGCGVMVPWVGDQFTHTVTAPMEAVGQ